MTGAGDIDWDAFDTAGIEFDKSALIAGRSCRDALGRVCRWHRDRGMKVVCQ